MQSQRIVKCCFPALAIFASAPAMAAVTCMTSATSVVFGTYNPLNAAPTDSTGQVTVSCTLTPNPQAANVSYTVTLSTGISGTMTSRTMLSGPNFLVYNLYTTSGYAQIWGNGLNGSAVVTGSMKLGRSAGGNYTDTRVHTVYGRIPPMQDVLPGAYADSIVVTVTY